MEKFPNIDPLQDENKPENPALEEKTPKKGLGGMISKIAAISSVAGFGFFGSLDNAQAKEGGVVTNTSQTNIEQRAKGSSLGKYYEKKFKLADERNAVYKESVAKAKQMLVNKGVEVTDDSKIAVEFKEGKLSTVILDGVAIPIESLSGATNQVDKAGDKIKSKTTVSDEAGEFL